MMPFAVLPQAVVSNDHVPGAKRTYVEGDEIAVFIPNIQSIHRHRTQPDTVTAIQYGGDDVDLVFVPFDRLIPFLVTFGRQMRQPEPSESNIISGPGLVVPS